MKKISVFALAAIVLFTGSGCLKDKGFEGQQYGTQIAEVKGVSFPEAARSPLGGSLDAVAAPQTITTKVHLEADKPATEAITVTITRNPALLPSGVVAIPATNYTVPATVTIPAGAMSVDVPIVISGANTFNPSSSYGLGLSLASVTPGNYVIAGNMKNLVYTFSLKNKYDGLWRLRGWHNRTPYTFTYDVNDMELRTLSANSVEFWWRSAGDNGHPIGISPTSVSWYGNTVAPVIVFNTTNDQVTDVYNKNLAAGGPPISVYTGAGSGQGRFTTVNGVKTIYVYWRYNANDLRAFMDTLTYIGPR